MRTFLVAAACVLSAAASGAQTPAKHAAPAAGAHVLLTPGDLKWGPAPPILPPGAQIAVLDGNPMAPGFFVLRLKFPNGYKIPAHSHPTDEHITVVEGTFGAGMGDVYADSGVHDFPVGSYIKMPKLMHHFAVAKGDVTVQIDGQGPFVVNYVHPSDDPSKKTSTR